MHKLLVLFTAALPLVLGALPALAGDVGYEAHVEKMVVALATDDFELAETDVSHLAVGEAETIHTESGQIIDILRTKDGLEIYVDGELVNADGPGLHEEHRVVHKRVEVICDGDEADCEEMVWISGGEDLDLEALHDEAHETKVIVIREREEIN